jgi:uncharacterized NAD-dependent epimerase/dehydratase family protein
MIGNFEVSGNAFLLSNGILHETDAKTSHGLIRHSDRFRVKAVIDCVSFGKDAGEVLDGINRDIPVFACLEDAIRERGKPDYCIVGVAPKGGVLPYDLKQIIKSALTEGISVVSGLHDYLSDQPEMVALANKYGSKLLDVRKPKSVRDLKFWSENIYDVKCPIIAILGTDCAIGKRTAALLLKKAFENAGLKTEMIYTGQTGWMQGGKYGFILDSTLNDFVSGEMSHAILNAYLQENPDLILLEGQSSLRNPSGPCGAEFLRSGNAKEVILIHKPKKKYFDSRADWGEIPSVASEIKLIHEYGSKVIALMLNTSGLTTEEAKSFKKFYNMELAIPVILTLEEGVEGLVQNLLNLRNEN